MKKLLTKILKWCLTITILFLAYTWFAEKTASTFHLPHITIGNPDPILGYTDVEIQETIMGESRKVKELIVFEQDLETETDLSNTFLDIEWFRKSQTMHSYGTAQYVVDLSKINANSIEIDPVNLTIKVHVPHATLKDVIIDYDKTTFDDIEREIFGWGEIKLTPEQQNEVEKVVYAEMLEKANTEELLKKADDSAYQQIYSLCKTLLTNLNPDTTIDIIFY